MPIHDQSYRRYGGGKAIPGRAWTVIARAGIIEMLRRRIFLAVLLAGWIPFVWYAIRLYLAVTYPQASSILAVTPDTFRQFFSSQDFFVFVLTVYAGSGLIANDRRANALQIYLSKPLARSEYIMGKAAVLLAFLLGVTLVPAMLLLLLQVLFSSSFEFLRKNLFLIPAITTSSLLQSLLATLTMLALSSFSKSARFVAIMY